MLSADEILHFICMRDEVYYNNRRVSKPFGLCTIYQLRSERQLPMFGNGNQASCSGKFLKSEVIFSIINSSHSYEELSSCPLPLLLQQSQMVELNAGKQYIPREQFLLLGVPPCYKKQVTIGPLSSISICR
jgi:hypothetical protein